MGCPSVGCKFMGGGVIGACVLRKGCRYYGGRVVNSMVACFRASLISFGACLYLVRNSWG